MKIKKRQISESLLKMLGEGGKYHEITKLVRIDPYLDMEMRGEDGVFVYYRGGKLLEVNENELLSLDKKYKSDLRPHIDSIFDYICKAKLAIDKYEIETRETPEKEIQQRIVYENNMSGNAEDTEYYVVDIEWVDNESNGRADIVAFQLLRNSNKVKLVIAEVKQGSGAIKTSKDNPGLKKHYDDYLKLKDNIDIQDFKADMLEVFKQKYKLGLVRIRKERKIFNPTLVRDVDFVFVLANYNPYSSILRKECESLPDDCKFFIASFMGYGLYERRIYSKKEVKEIFQDTFTRKP